MNINAVWLVVSYEGETKVFALEENAMEYYRQARPKENIFGEISNVACHSPMKVRIEDAQ